MMDAPTDLDRLIQLLSKLPGLGPRSGRRAALYLLRHKDALMKPLADTMGAVADLTTSCGSCGNFDVVDPCSICQNHGRDGHTVCVVEGVADLWAMERTGAFHGFYHVLGGALSAIDGVGPDQLRIPHLLDRLVTHGTIEVILALNATIEGQTTAHYIADCLKDRGVSITALAHGVPMGGELDFLDDGTLLTALRARRQL